METHQIIWMAGLAIAAWTFFFLWLRERTARIRLWKMVQLAQSLPPHLQAKVEERDGKTTWVYPEHTHTGRNVSENRSGFGDDKGRTVARVEGAPYLDLNAAIAAHTAKERKFYEDEAILHTAKLEVAAAWLAAIKAWEEANDILLRPEIMERIAPPGVGSIVTLKLMMPGDTEHTSASVYAVVNSNYERACQELAQLLCIAKRKAAEVRAEKPKQAPVVQIPPGSEQAQVIEDIKAERSRQDHKWGEQNHDPFFYLAILGEEYGETCNAALELFWGARPLDPTRLFHLRCEAMQTAAVAMAIVECLDRAKWKFPYPDKFSSNPVPTP